MIKKLRVNLKERSYDIIIGKNILNRLGTELKRLKIGQDAIIITNSFLKKKFSSCLIKILKEKGFRVNILIVPDSEKAKSAETVLDLVNNISAIDKSKNPFIIALGGGVVGDVSGFAASIYKRGIPYVQVPTTFLAQVDSSIGGKTAVNLADGKNLMGAFYQPRLVLCDIGYLSSLSKRELVAGLAEAIKYGIIDNEELFEYIEKNIVGILSFKAEHLYRVVYECVKIKADIVSRDERETKSIRTFLNLGHTIGHAIEACAGYGVIRHGEAVAVGILCACDIAQDLSFFTKENKDRVESLVKSAGLATRVKGLNVKKVLKAHYKDKKFIGKLNRFVLPVAIGKVIVKKNVPLKLIEKTVKERLI